MILNKVIRNCTKKKKGHQHSLHYFLIQALHNPSCACDKKLKRTMNNKMIKATNSLVNYHNSLIVRNRQYVQQTLLHIDERTAKNQAVEGQIHAYKASVYFHLVNTCLEVYQSAAWAFHLGPNISDLLCCSTSKSTSR